MFVLVVREATSAAPRCTLRGGSDLLCVRPCTCRASRFALGLTERRLQLTIHGAFRICHLDHLDKSMLQPDAPGPGAFGPQSEGRWVRTLLSVVRPNREHRVFAVARTTRGVPEGCYPRTAPTGSKTAVKWRNAAGSDTIR